LILDALEAFEPGPYLIEMRSIIRTAASKDDIRGLRMVRRDLLEASQALTADQRQALQARLTMQEADDPIRRGAS
jgi:hypothetical protein